MKVIGRAGPLFKLPRSSTVHFIQLDQKCMIMFMDFNILVLTEDSIKPVTPPELNSETIKLNNPLVRKLLECRLCGITFKQVSKINK